MRRDDLPLVSCIMPTADRHAFVPWAVRDFLAQDYPRKELVVLDDGEVDVRDLIPARPDIRYFREDEARILGDKRNRLCALARGDLIAHWDDDDWQSPGRLGYQVRALLAAGADVCGITRALFLEPEAGRAWQYVYPDRGRRWLSGSTLCYRREVALRHPFPSVPVGEDVRFLEGFDPRKVLVLDDCDFHVGIIHAGNASPKRTEGARWRPVDRDRVESLMGAAATRYRTSQGPRAAAAGTRGRALVAAAYGIGDILRATPLVRALERLGYAVDFLVAPDYPDTVSLIDDRRYVRRTVHYREFRTNRGEAPLPELAGEHYDVAVFSHWARPLARHVRARRVLLTDSDRWLRAGDHDCNRHHAEALGWQEALPEAFALTSQRDFALPAGTVALHPGCKQDWPWKKWHGFADVARQLDSVVVVGSDADRDSAGTYFGEPLRWPAHVRDFSGALSLADTASLLSQCAAVLSNDSGIMQLSTALGVPTFGVFGITSPERELMPQANVTALTKGLACEAACRRGPWGRRDCEHGLECLRTLTADEVVRSMSSVVRRRTVRTAARPRRRDAARPGQLSLTYYGYVFDASGYGRAARAYIHALERAGVDLTVVDLGSRPRQVDDELVASLVGSPGDSDLRLFHAIPSQWARLAFPHRNTIGMTVWETDTLPGQWRNALNHTLDVWVPSHFNVECFRHALERPVFRLPHPVHEPAAPDPARLERIDDWLGIAAGDRVFYSVFEWQDRKNPGGLLEAFMRAFPGPDGPVLVVKSNPGSAAIARDTLESIRRRVGSAARVLLRCEAWSDAEIAALHERGDCYVSLHLGEGWGYPVFDAASRGTPVVATGYSGPLDFLGRDYPGLVAYDLAAVRQPYVYYSGLMQWAQPRLEHAVERLRWVCDHGEEARRSARQTRERILREFSLDAVGRVARRRLLEVLCRINPRRGQKLRTRALATELRPPRPIPGEWYDADYFEHGVKSNWREGYHWSAFQGLFRDTAQLLTEVFTEAGSFIDAGCAKGFLVRALREAGRDAWGCDHSRFALDCADEATRPYLVESCVSRLEPGRRFDVTVAMNLLESLTESQAARFLEAARAWTDQALVAVIVATRDDADPGRDADDGDLSRVIRRPRSWWHELFLQAGWRQDALHRVAQRTCQEHALAARMGWQLFVYSPGRPG